MSHFSTIKTKIKDKEILVQALLLLQYDVQEDQELINPINHQHEKVKVDVSIGNDIGFRLNKNGEYELVADIQTWDLDVPVQRFIDKLTQQYAVQNIKKVAVEEGFNVEQQIKNVNGEVELVVTRWT
tara:strand:+ start:325 stop:705 length:381 start_codon:yes stop_codon:yes gene_type:complete